jgi:hypothetical protein
VESGYIRENEFHNRTYEVHYQSNRAAQGTIVARAYGWQPETSGPDNAVKVKKSSHPLSGTPGNGFFLDFFTMVEFSRHNHALGSMISQ